MENDFDGQSSARMPAYVLCWVAICCLGVLVAVGALWLDRHRPGVKPQAMERTRPPRPASGEILRCNATWYAYPEHGRRTASGEIFDSTALTTAVWSGFLQQAPYGSRLVVYNPANGKWVVVRVNDNLPSKWAKVGRMLDLSKAAAESIGIVQQGVAPVEAWREE